jgi:acyl-coenzyme A thioesterase PaaI-like protein
VHSGRNLVRVSAEVSDTNGKLIATGNLTFFVVGELDL